jgi:hypothetical protein
MHRQVGELLTDESGVGCDVAAFDYPPLDRRITVEEFQEAIKLAREAGQEDGVTV